MTHAEKRMIIETAAKVAVIETQMLLLTDALDELVLAIAALKPRRGRPPKPQLTIVPETTLEIDDLNQGIRTD